MAGMDIRPSPAAYEKALLKSFCGIAEIGSLESRQGVSNLANNATDDVAVHHRDGCLRDLR